MGRESLGMYDCRDVARRRLEAYGNIKSHSMVSRNERTEGGGINAYSKAQQRQQ